ncbi:HAD-IB family phosphatase [Paucibacter sp. KBW04]|uniref:HAD-IB family phosphatase n=1 Tax=Paucibacter sp. KBW04 TaxID=2153361 RepID=UPI0018CC5A5E|nr:HAD-IB family phosphatase [Paucibacter sp. KBW04]
MRIPHFFLTIKRRLSAWWQGLGASKRPASKAPESLAKDRALGGSPTIAMPMTRYATVIIPALNEARRIAEVVRYALADEATSEVLVIDDSSIDDTARLAREAGARVITSTILGKGASMCDGALSAKEDLLVYLDGDLSGLQPGIVSKLCRPLLRDEADFVKARFGRSGGRVTELTAKPMLKVFFPEVAHLGQPLGGIIAARRSLMRSLSFEGGYGVDIGLLLDAHRAGARLVEVDIGSLEHDSQPLLDLTLMANEVARVIYSRARASGRLHVEQVIAMYETQRQAQAELDYILTRRRGRQRILLLDMDGTVTRSRFALELARATGREAELMTLLDGPNDDAATRSARIAALFKFVHQREFERVAHKLELRPGAIEFVNRMRRAGFMVGLVSDSYFVAADIVHRRLFADFALAHLLQFDAEICAGRLLLNSGFLAHPADEERRICKSHVLRRLREDLGEPPVAEIWAMGDNINDLAMLRSADKAFAMEPKSAQLREVPGVIVVKGFEELLAHVPAEHPEAA